VVRPPVVTRRATGDRQYARYVDPENAENIYSRGAIPGWMKQKMQDQGYDPSKKADRDVFKANYLRVKEG
jgi:DNA-binding protein H-NS